MAGDSIEQKDKRARLGNTRNTSFTEGKPTTRLRGKRLAHKSSWIYKLGEQLDSGGIGVVHRRRTHRIVHYEIEPFRASYMVAYFMYPLLYEPKIAATKCGSLPTTCLWAPVSYHRFSLFI